MLKTWQRSVETQWRYCVRNIGDLPIFVILRNNALKVYFGLGEDKALWTGGGGVGRGVYRKVLHKRSTENPNTHHS